MLLLGLKFLARRARPKKSSALLKVGRALGALGCFRLVSDPNSATFFNPVSLPPYDIGRVIRPHIQHN